MGTRNELDLRTLRASSNKVSPNLKNVSDESGQKSQFGVSNFKGQPENTNGARHDEIAASTNGNLEFKDTNITAPPDITINTGETKAPRTIDLTKQRLTRPILSRL